VALEWVHARVVETDGLYAKVNSSVALVLRWGLDYNGSNGSFPADTNASLAAFGNSEGPRAVRIGVNTLALSASLPTEDCGASDSAARATTGASLA
jgi:hypothetical protein